MCISNNSPNVTFEYYYDFLVILQNIEVNNIKLVIFIFYK